MGKLKQTVYGLIILLIGVGTLHAADLKDGFLGIKWRTPISELPDFVKVSEKYGVSYYGHPKKSYTIFGVENPSVIYGFYEEKFFAVFLICLNILLLIFRLNQLRYSAGSKTILSKNSDLHKQY